MPPAVYGQKSGGQERSKRSRELLSDGANGKVDDQRRVPTVKRSPTRRRMPIRCMRAGRSTTSFAHISTSLPATATPLTQAQVDLIGAWIGAGALND